MKEEITSLLLGELFPPNCRVRVRGEHFFTDGKLYSNLYGLAFFSDTQSFGQNPYISPSCEKLPGILDNYFNDPFPISSNVNSEFEIRDAITANINEKFFIKKTAKSVEKKPIIDCIFTGHINHENENSILITYGAVLPTTLCITDDDTISAVLPFSPFPYLTFFKGNRTFSTVDYPLPTEPMMPPEAVTVDYAVTVKKMEIALNDNLTGKIFLDYSIEVGVTKCEITKLTIEILPLDDGDDE